MTQDKQEQQAVKFAQMLRDFAAALLNPAHHEHMRLLARHRRIKFLAYVAEGFSEAQALELCRHD